MLNLYVSCPAASTSPYTCCERPAQVTRGSSMGRLLPATVLPSARPWPWRRKSQMPRSNPPELFLIYSTLTPNKAACPRVLALSRLPLAPLRRFPRCSSHMARSWGAVTLSVGPVSKTSFVSLCLSCSYTSLTRALSIRDIYFSMVEFQPQKRTWSILNDVGRLMKRTCVLICLSSGGQNKIPEIVWLTQQKCNFSQFWGLEVRD